MTVLWFDIDPKNPQAYLLTCPLPMKSKHLIPVHVSLVENSCEKATNHLKVTYNKAEGPSKEGFAVCVRRLVVPKVDIAVRLAEWIEFISLLGADKVFLSVVEIEPKVQKVSLEYVLYPLLVFLNLKLAKLLLTRLLTFIPRQT